MKNNNKGFTLVELLAVVVVLLMISVIAIASISAAIERNKTKQDNAKKSVIVNYGKLYYDANKIVLDDYKVGCISLDVLNLSDTEVVDSDKKRFTGQVQYTKTKTSVSFRYVENGECIQEVDDGDYPDDEPVVTNTPIVSATHTITYTKNGFLYPIYNDINNNEQFSLPYVQECSVGDNCNIVDKKYIVVADEMDGNTVCSVNIYYLKWTDGTNTYEPLQSIVLNGDITLSPINPDNTTYIRTNSTGLCGGGPVVTQTPTPTPSGTTTKYCCLSSTAHRYYESTTYSSGCTVMSSGATCSGCETGYVLAGGGQCVKASTPTPTVNSIWCCSCSNQNGTKYDNRTSCPSGMTECSVFNPNICTTPTPTQTPTCTPNGTYTYECGVSCYAYRYNSCGKYIDSVYREECCTSTPPAPSTQTYTQRKMTCHYSSSSANVGSQPKGNYATCSAACAAYMATYHSGQYTDVSGSDNPPNCKCLWCKTGTISGNSCVSSSWTYTNSTGQSSCSVDSNRACNSTNNNKTFIYECIKE